MRTLASNARHGLSAHKAADPPSGAAEIELATEGRSLPVPLGRMRAVSWPQKLRRWTGAASGASRGLGCSELRWKGSLEEDAWAATAARAGGVGMHAACMSARGRMSVRV